jgi:hypothetical protein
VSGDLQMVDEEVVEKRMKVSGIKAYESERWLMGRM